MSLHTVSTHLRMLVVIAIGSTVATSLVAGSHARAQARPAVRRAMAKEVHDTRSGKATSDKLGASQTAGKAASSPTVPSAAPSGAAPPDAVPSGQTVPDEGKPAQPMPENQSKALALMAEGKALAEEFLLTDAIKKYREALKYWDHPLIHYNLSRLLNALERPLEAYWSVERALRADPATLSDHPAQAQQIHAHLLKLRDQLRARLVEIQIASTGPDVEVSVGNRAVATAPVKSELFLPGTHRMAAQAPRHWPLLHAMALPSGATVHLRLTSQRAFTPWKPWALTSAGTAVALAGFGLYWHGRNQRDTLAGEVEARCQPSCADGMLAAFDRDWHRARTLQHVGVGTLITGGSAALLGVGLVLWNQRRELRLIGNEHPVSILPVASPEMTGVVGTATF
jgi:hypothetical protein